MIEVKDRYRSKDYIMKSYLIWTMALLILIGGCNIEKPSLPSWDVELNIPLMNQQYLLSELIDGEYITLGENNVLYLQNTGELSTPEFGELEFSIPLDTPAIPLFVGAANTGTFSTQDPSTGFRIAHGRISNGSIQARFSNVSNQVQDMSVVFDGLFDSSGNPYRIDYAGNSGWITRNLNGSSLGQLNSQQFLDELSFSVQIDSSLPNGTPAASLELRIPDEIRFSFFQGNITNYVLESQGDVETIDITYPYGVDEAIELQTASLVVNLTNHIGFTAEYQGEIYAINNTTGQSRIVPIKDAENNNFELAPALDGVPTISTIEVTNGISELLQIMPHHIEIRNSSMTFGSTDSTQIGTVNSTDKVVGAYTVSAPFTFKLNDNLIRLRDPLEIEISETNRERIAEHGISGGLRLQVLNKLPIGANASIYIGTNDSLDINDPSSYRLKRDVSIASYNTNSGFQSIDELLISEEELDIFTNPKIYVQMAFSFNTAGEFVTITASPADFIQIRGMVSAKIRIEETE